MIKTSLHKISNFLVFLILISTTFISCEKEDKTIGIIKVVNSEGIAISGVTVILSQDNTIPGNDPISNLTKTKTTGSDGKASFEYTYEAILDVNVNKISGNNTYSGNGVIRLLKGKTEQITIEALK